MTIKKKFAYFGLAIMILSIMAGIVNAEETISMEQDGVITEKIELAPAGVTPDEPWLYWLDRFAEKIDVVLTVNIFDKASLLTNQMEERLSEMKVMVQLRNAEGYKKAEKERQSLEDKLEKATLDKRWNAQYNAGLANKLEKHIQVLEVFQSHGEKEPSMALINFTNHAGKSKLKLQRIRGRANQFAEATTQEEINNTLTVQVQ